MTPFVIITSLIVTITIAGIVVVAVVVAVVAVVGVVGVVGVVVVIVVGLRSLSLGPPPPRYRLLPDYDVESMKKTVCTSPPVTGLF